MSLSTALNAALSGLMASGRAASLTSDNIANASTPGYGRRALEVSSQLLGSGVKVNGVTRHADPVLIANRRVAEADQAAASAVSSFYTRLTSAVGSASDPYSIASRLSSFEGSLIEASSRPDSAIRLDQIAVDAVSLATALNDASDAVQEMRSDADRQIGTLVEDLNASLSELQVVNSRITSSTLRGASVTSLMDRRQQIVDKINAIVPVNVVAREHNQIAVYSEGGAILLDGSAATIGFSASNTLVPSMTIDNGNVSGLTINGFSVRTDSVGGALRGGSLGAAFQIRDELGVAAQTDLDVVARDLIERYETPGLDPTVAANAPGLFTDMGNAFDPALEVGLSGRIQVNVAVDPNGDNETWRLRDGLGAAGPGPIGNAAQLNAFREVLTVERTLASGDFGTGTMAAADVGTALISRVNQRANNAENTLTYANTILHEMSEIELSQSVDTDLELQNLLRIEQAYAANARMIEVVDDLMERLLRI